MPIWDLVGIAAGGLQLGLGGKAAEIIGDVINSSVSNTIGSAVQQVVGGGVLYNTFGPATNVVADINSLKSKIPVFEKIPGLNLIFGLAGNNTLTLSDNNSFQYYGTTFQAKHGVGDVQYIDHQPGVLRTAITVVALGGVVFFAAGIIAAKIGYAHIECSSGGSDSSSSGASGSSSNPPPSFKSLQKQIDDLKAEQQKESQQQQKAQKQQDFINRISNILGPATNLLESSWLGILYALELSDSKVASLQQELDVMAGQLVSLKKQLSALSGLVRLPAGLPPAIAQMVSAINADLVAQTNQLATQRQLTLTTLTKKTGVWFKA